MPAAVPAAASGEAWHSAWGKALGELELDIDRAEALLDAVHTGAALPDAAELLATRWTAPSKLGPLPHPMLVRAQQLLLRQSEVVDDLAHAARTARRHVSAAGAIADRTAPPAVFVDVAM